MYGTRAMGVARDGENPRRRRSREGIDSVEIGTRHRPGGVNKATLKVE
jgi:hypothetical protein